MPKTHQRALHSYMKPAYSTIIAFSS